MATTIWGLPNGKALGNRLTSAEVNKLGDSAELFFVQLAELVGSGFFLTTDFNLTLIPGALSVEVSAGTAIVGPTDGRAVVMKTGVTFVGAAEGMLASKSGANTNRVWLKRDGTFTVTQSDTEPEAGAQLCGTADTDATQGTSQNNAPALRSNLGTLLTSARNLPLTVANGGTGATSAGAARTNLGAAASGANSDISSLSGLVTALSVGQGGTGATTAAGAQASLGVPPNARAVSTGVGLTGGGDLSANRTLALTDAVQDALPDVAITVSAEAADVIQVSAQFRDLADANLAQRMGALCWLSDAAHAAPTATAPSGGIAAGAGYLVHALTANIRGWYASDAAGLIRLDLAEVGARTWYLHVLFDGVVYVSPAITFA